MLRADLIRPVGELLRGHASARGPEPAFRDDERSEDWAGIERRTAAMGAAMGAALRRLVRPIQRHKLLERVSSGARA